MLRKWFPRGWPYAAALLLVSSAYACRRYVFEFQPKSTYKLEHIELTVDRPSETDVLFVVDSSGSMKQHQENLQRNISAYIDVLAKSPNKFQIAVTTTDLNECTDVPPAGNQWDGKCGRLLSPDGNDPIIRRVDYADNVALADRFRQVVSAVGTGGSGYEQGLKAAARAVDPELTAAGKPNSGFVRPGALLMIVILSDESDCSYSYDQQKGHAQFIGLNLEGGETCYKFRDKLEPVQAWADRITVAKGRKSLGAVCAITAGQGRGRTFTPGNCVIDSAAEPSNACSCFYAQSLNFCAYPFPETEVAATRQPPPGQSVNCGAGKTCCVGNACCIAMADERYVKFADNFRLRFKDSICRGNYGETLRTCAQISTRDCFTLEHGPMDGREDYITVKRKLFGEAVYENVPQVSAEVGFEGDGWFLFTDRDTVDGVPVAEVCLAGTYKRTIGDTYEIKVFTEAIGVDSDIPADAE
ncbi:MAG: VWA domain-containing protein [Deltaproteobacteria bacterium]|nr:VWA domain-containing protein [Deltaproteobacteria bacterium]